MNDDSGSSKATKNVLLGELESIQNLLLDNLTSDLVEDAEKTESLDFEELDDELDTAIPILEDIVSTVENDVDHIESDFLNLIDIFASGTISDDKVIHVTDDTLQPADSVAQNVESTDVVAQGDTTFNIDADDDLARHLPEIIDDREIGSPSLDAADKKLEFLIQELVDEFIPLMEDRLRQRLSQCAPAIIRELSEKHLND